MRGKLIASAVVASLVLAGPALAESPQDRLQGLLASFQQDCGFPGVTATIALPDGNVVTAAGLADREARAPMRPETRMLAASIGKSFVAMTNFVSAHRDALSAMPVAFFTMHMLALGDDSAAVAERAKYTAKARNLITPTEEAFFEGMIDPARLSFLDRLAVRIVKTAVGDRRDWERIAGWTDRLASRLASAPT